MNQIIKSKTINFSELVKNSNTTLSLDYQSKMVDFLNNELTDEESQFYIAGLILYLNYHPTNDFPVNLEHVFKMMGFANKENAKRTLKNNFALDEDYKILLVRTDERKNEENRGGQNREDVMLNVDTLKNLFLLAKTPEGKKARKYFIKIENMNHKVLKMEMDEQKLLLEEKDKLLIQTQKQLETKTKLKVKRWYDSEPGHTIYGYTSNDSDKISLVTIGKTRNVKLRESSYMTHNQTSEMFHIKCCYNSDLAEKVIHHILDKHRVENNKEWFCISKELTIYTIDMVCDFLDSFIGCSDELINLKVNEQLSICIEQANIIKKNIEEVEVEVKVKVKVDLTKNNKVIEKINEKNDIDKFIKEFCVIDKDVTCITFELLGAYRIWLRGCSLDSRKQLTQYMKNNFESKTILYNEYDQTELLTYIGIKPKEYIILQEDPIVLPKYEEFVLSQCKFGYTYRMRWTEFIDTYIKWSGNTLLSEEKINLEAYINRHFLKDRINLTGHKNVPGIWGLQLKSDNTFKVGTNKSNRKQIVKINTETNEIIEKYVGLVFASRKLNIDNRILSKYIISEKIFEIDNIKFMYKYV